MIIPPAAVDSDGRSEAAVGGVSRLVRDLLQPIRIGIEVDALGAAEPDAVSVGDGVSQRPDQWAGVDGLLRCCVWCDQKLLGVYVHPFVDHADQRVAADIEPVDAETNAGPIEPGRPVACLE